MSPIGEHDSIGTDENQSAPADQRWRVTCNCGHLVFRSNEAAALKAHEAHFWLEKARAPIDRVRGSENGEVD